MQLLEWNNEKMALGIKSIDEQHKELLNIINQLTTTIKENSQKRDILTIVNQLIKYAKFHFNEEEKLFDKFNYKESIEHKHEHTKFLDKFNELENNIINNTTYKNKSAIEISEDVFNFLTKWFIEHIIGNDRKYVELFKEQGIK